MIISNLSVKFGNNTVFNNFNFELADNTITCVLGASGSGKTTLLKAVAGLVPYSGVIDKAVCSYIFQEPRLLPNKTVYDNVKFVLKSDKSALLNDKTVTEMLKTVELNEHKGLYPHQLSGGMAQRVAIARGLVYPSELLLMDEPFKGLDLALQNRLINEFLKAWQIAKRTTIFVTHSIYEALLVADRVVVIKQSIGAEIISDIPINILRENRALGNKDIDDIRTQLHHIMIAL